MGKTVYLECYSGISGDMTVAALLDLGASERALREALDALPVHGYEIKISRTKKNGIEAMDFDVILDQEPHHDHRSYRHIMEMLEKAELKDEVRRWAQKIFEIIGTAEARVHGVEIDDVHFHETGAVDSIVDIVGTAACLVDLGITSAYVSPLYEGRGFVKCQHGLIPVPAPAVSEIAREKGLTLSITETEGEMVTPTGAAIAAALWCKKSLPEGISVEKIGIGAGKKEFPHANILRAMLLKETEDEGDEIWVLTTNVDDCTGEQLGYTAECLLSAGAKDVAYMPIFMKKGRPAYGMEVLCKEDKVPLMEEIIFRETTSIGIRKHKEKRRVLKRKIIELDTPNGEAEVKAVKIGEETRMYPEYESVKKISKETKRSYREIYQYLVEEAWKKNEED